MWEDPFRLVHCYVTSDNLQLPSKHVINRKIEGTGRRGRILKHLLGDLKETREDNGN